MAGGEVAVGGEGCRPVAAADEHYEVPAAHTIQSGDLLQSPRCQTAATGIQICELLHRVKLRAVLIVVGPMHWDASRRCGSWQGITGAWMRAESTLALHTT